MATKHNNIKEEQANDTLKIKDLLFIGLSKWRWFVISLAIAIGAAFAYILYTPSLYTRTASVLIKEDSNGQSLSSDIGSFSEFGLFNPGSNVNNELIEFSSPALMVEVVKRLHLEMNYVSHGRFHRDVAYGSNLPVMVSMSNFPDNESAKFTLNISEDGTFYLSDFMRNGEDIDSEEIYGELRDTIITPLGEMTITPNNFYKKGQSYSFYVTHSARQSAVEVCLSRLSVALSDAKASIINLSYKDPSIQRAEDVLNTLIAIYNENWVKDKNQIAVGTSMFINERLGMIEHELDSVDEDISSYKSEHLLPDVQAASSIYMAQSNTINSQILTLNTQLYMTRYVRNYLVNESNKTQLLPSNSGIESSNIEAQIAEYNTTLLRRNTLAANSSEQSPLVADMDNSLTAMREAIVTSIDNQVVTLNAQIESLLRNERQTTSRIADNPTQAKYLLSVERQQKVKEALYLFLLQKREENELSQAFTAYNTRVITPPSGSMLPTAPVRRNIFLMAFALGLLVPIVIIFLRETMNTKIRGRKDLESISVPFLGEIPLLLSKKRVLSKKNIPELRETVVKGGSRDAVNEAFRVLRTNLEFMTDMDKYSNIIAVTSFNIGSGKSFISMNLGACLAIKGKKVLVIDGDMRHASTSTYVGAPKLGLSDYLSGRVERFEDLIVAAPRQPDLFVLPVGTIPPNPTELLLDERLKHILDSVRTRYDYVFIDCPPIELVADTQIINTMVSRTIFVVRAGLLERSLVATLDGFYRDKKYKNISVILNGTIGVGGSYGYKYGYHSYYGHGYGYGPKKKSKIYY